MIQFEIQGTIIKMKIILFLAISYLAIGNGHSGGGGHRRRRELESLNTGKIVTQIFSFALLVSIGDNEF